VEGLGPSEAEKENIHGVRAGYLETPATTRVMAHHKKEENKNILDEDDDTSGFTGTLAVSRSMPAVIRREQWEVLENEHYEYRNEQFARIR
jgi:hypothetical protein